MSISNFSIYREKHIIEARKILKNKQKYVFSATKYEHPIQRAFSIKYKASLFQKNINLKQNARFYKLLSRCGAILCCKKIHG